MTQDVNPQNDLKPMALCDSCAGIQRNWRKAPGHPELVQGTHRTETHKHGQVTITNTVVNAVAPPGSTRTTRSTATRAGRWWGASPTVERQRYFFGNFKALFAIGAR